MEVGQQYWVLTPDDSRGLHELVRATIVAFTLNTVTLEWRTRFGKYDPVEEFVATFRTVDVTFAELIPTPGASLTVVK